MYFIPPAALLDDCKLPERENIKTTGDLVRIVKEDEDAIALVNANLYVLREYRANLLRLRGAK